MRDRLIVARELLTETGSVFIQIGDENVHLLKNLLDKVFGDENFVCQIIFQKTGGFPSTIPSIADYLLWYAKSKPQVKSRNLYSDLPEPFPNDPNYVQLEFINGNIRRMTLEEQRREKPLPIGAKVFRYGPLMSAGKSNTSQEFEFEGEVHSPSGSNH